VLAIRKWGRVVILYGPSQKEEAGKTAHSSLTGKDLGVFTEAYVYVNEVGECIRPGCYR
jgi:hypothetical protein